MLHVIKPDGTVVDIDPARNRIGRGRLPKYPWRWLDVGDHFVADNDDYESVRILVSTFKQVRVEHEIGRSPTPGTFTVTRKT